MHAVLYSCACPYGSTKIIQPIASQNAVENLVELWISAYAIAIVVSLLAMFMKCRAFYQQLRLSILHMHAYV